MTIRHAGLIARRDGSLWRGVLIEGASGAGKSDLMLRALDQGWVLVADDRVILWSSAGRVFGRAPAALAGLIEIRGLDVVAAPFKPFVGIDLVAICAEPGGVERLPSPETVSLLNQAIPAFSLVATESSAPGKLAQALSHLGLNA